MSTSLKKAPAGPTNLFKKTKKRGRSIASVAVSFAIPFTAWQRGVTYRTSLRAMPFDPDINAVLPLVKRAFAHSGSVDLKSNRQNNQNTHKWVEDPTSFRAVAQHRKFPRIVEVLQTRGMQSECLGLDLSNPSASNRPVKTVLSHVCATHSMRFVTGLRQRLACAQMRTSRRPT